MEEKNGLKINNNKTKIMLSSFCFHKYKIRMPVKNLIEKFHFVNQRIRINKKVLH